MTDRKRDPLPADYQFGDAADYGVQMRTFRARRKARSDRPDEPDHVHTYEMYDPGWHAYRCRCGLIGARGIA